jgi:BlaI family transcriptional regulator, penicillinase repressor
MRLTEAEWRLMNALWGTHPASARDVLERLEPRTDWAYTTVKTMLTRLEAKGAVQSRIRANTALYEPVLTRSQARRSALKALAEAAFDGAFGSMMHFLVSERSLTKKQKDALKRLLEEEAKSETKGENE